MTFNIQIVGVGGQGVLLASIVIGGAAMADGYQVVMSEVHGMAQRGGSVVSTVRIGDGMMGPLIPKGGADLLLGFEPVETYRSLEYANESTYIITNTHPIIPITVSGGADEYPEVETLLERMRAVNSRVIALDATEIAKIAGGAIATNSVLIGAAAAVDSFPVSKKRIEDELLHRIPDRFSDLNKRAFQMGYDEIRSALDR